MKLEVKDNVKYFLNNDWHEVVKGDVIELSEKDAKVLLAKDKKHFKKTQ